MVNITNTTQLSIFSLVRAALLANSTLSVKFTNSHIHQFEPKHKSSAFTGFPYILVNIPELDQEKVVFDNNLTLKEVNVSLILRMDYFARDKYLSFANAIVKSIEDYESTFESSGYYDVMIELLGTDSNIVIESKELVEGTFELRYHGQVSRG